MNIKLNKIIFLSLIVSTSLFAKTLYLDDLVEGALVNSPDLKISKADYEASKQNVIQADAGYLPSVDLAAMAGRQGVDYGDQQIGSSGVQIGKSTTSLLGAQVNVKQLIYDFGKTTGNMENFQSQSKAFKAAMHQSISDKIYAVKKAYYELLYNSALIEVNKENIKLNEQQLNRAQRYFEAGIRTKVDVTDAKVNLIKAQLSLNNSRYDTKLALIQLYNVIGYNNDNTKLNIYIENLNLENAYSSLPKLSQKEIYYKKEAFKNRPDLTQYKQLLESKKSQYKQILGDYYPSIYANAQYTIQDVDNDAFIPNEQWKTTVSLEWNLFSGNKTLAQEENIRINILKAQSDLDNIKLQIQKRVSNAFINVYKELDYTKLSQSLSFASKEKFIQVQKRYEHGLADFIELQEARQTYISARANLAQSYYKYYIAIAKLNNAIGK